MMARPSLNLGKRPGKSPWLAVNLSAVVPGAGQLYSGALARGLAIALAHGLAVGFMGWSIFAPQGNTLRGLLMLPPLLALYLFNLWDSHWSARRGLTLAQVSPLRYRPTDPWYPVALSHLLPGLGQLFLQQAIAGGSFLLLAVGVAYLANFYPRLLPLPPLLWAVSCGLAYQATHYRPRQWAMLAGLLATMMAVRLVVGAVPVLVRHQVEQCWVPSESMVPTLMVGDRTFVRKTPHYRPQAGDIVVFANPEARFVETGQPPTTAADLVVKRVIALPGQRVAVSQGQVWINDFPLVEPYLAEPPGYAWGPATVPPGHLFVLGDNRNHSRDSHLWGFIPERLVLGRAYKIYWPPDRIQSLA